MDDSADWQESVRFADNMVSEGTSTDIDTETKTFNVEKYSEYREALIFSFYLMPVLAILLQLACFKNRKVARVFYYMEMINMLQMSFLPREDREI